mmetsp:Transcript_21217/g.48781  ORF Transcript_21217/g.48781 Transcript_21217/m.48781 type:complete len:224 (-) Transcript_21217:415-1086(-)
MADTVVDTGTAAALSRETLIAAITLLKRKLVESERNREDAQKRERDLAAEIEVEKREHQRTTQKLSQLLNKRGAAPMSEEVQAELNMLKETVASLRRELQQARESRQRPGAAPERSVLDARREITPETSLSHGVQVGPIPHAALPHTAKPAEARAAPEASSVKRSLDITRGASLPDGAACASTSTCMPCGGSKPMVAQARVPYGYASGAICVEQPKRQRSDRS